MLITFRQGLVRVQSSPAFLSLSSGDVNLNANTDPTIIAFAHGSSDYLFTENSSITGAWSGPFNSGTSYWLYWNIDLFTGIRTFGYTTVDPDTDGGFGSTLPSTPLTDQHFFDTSEGKMKVWNGSSWNTVIRVFAGNISSGGVLTPETEGSQINLTQIKNVGHILFDSDGSPVKKFDRLGRGHFFTTESPLNSQTNRLNSYDLK